MPLDLSIIILSYKSKEHLKVLLPSIFSSTKKYSYEIIVVDNDSKDGTAEAVESLLSSAPNLKLIRNKNTGYAAGNNLAIKKTQGRYILLLNPDTKLNPDTLEKMLDLMEARLDVGIGGCKLLKADGSLDLACRRRFPNPWNSFKRLFLRNNIDYNYLNVLVDHEMEVDSVVGAFMLMRKSLLDKIGLLDEAFFMYGEDLDICWRCKQAGFKVWYFPKSAAMHYKGESSKKVSFRALLWFHNSMWVFYKKHYWQKYPLVLHVIVWLGIKLRFFAMVVLNVFRSKKYVSR